MSEAVVKEGFDESLESLRCDRRDGVLGIITFSDVFR